MEEKLRQIESLLSMFDARDQMWAKHNRQIAKVITPTVLDSLVELFDLPTEDVEWVDLQLMENILLVICTVTYDPHTTQSTFLQRIDAVKQPDTPIQVQRFLRVGVPLAIVFAEKPEIKEFLSRIPVETTEDDDEFEIHPAEDIEDTPQKLEIVASKVMGFDTNNLSEDQIKNLMLYHHTVDGTKQ